MQQTLDLAREIAIVRVDFEELRSPLVHATKLVSPTFALREYRSTLKSLEVERSSDNQCYQYFAFK